MLIGFGIAFYFQRRTKTAEDWAMGGRSLPSYVIVFTQFATLVGGGVLVGHVSIWLQLWYGSLDLRNMWRGWLFYHGHHRSLAS